MPANEIVKKFYQLNLDIRAGKSQMEELRAILADDFIFSGPLMKIEGADKYVGLLANFIPFHEDLKIIKHFVDGEEACVITELTLKSPSGKIFKMDIAECLTVENNKLKTHTIYYDPREFSEAFPMQ